MSHIQKVPGHLSMAEGLAIQREQIANWKPKLSEACFDALVAEAQLQNHALCAISGATGYDVWRGTDILMFIENWKPAN